jgi:methionyl-tRNA formyltransferase
MGTPDFAVPSLEFLLRTKHEVVAVVTAPDKPRGRGQELQGPPVKAIALQHHLPLFQPEELSDPSFIDSLRKVDPDLIVVVAFRILPKAVFLLPRLGAINLHASLLPRYRGAAPINWAIIRGETRTGVTTFFLEEKVDTGRILLQAETPILPDDDAGSLHDRLAVLGAQTLCSTVQLIESGTASPKEQDPALASPAPKIYRDDCRIRWDQPAERIRDFIRGLSPSPAAFTQLEGRVLKIFRAAALPQKSEGEPGLVSATESALSVASTDRELAILELQLEGRTRMSVQAFLRGYPVKSGTRLV